MSTVQEKTRAYAMLRVAALVAATTAGTGCRGDDELSVTDRLWVSAVPTRPRANVSAFATSRTTGSKVIGVVFEGSAYRGHHDVFEWHSEGKDAADVRFLQDGRASRWSFEPCTPTRGFDRCLLVTRDRGTPVQYQSRKRWRLGRKRKQETETEAHLLADILSLAATENATE